MTVEADELGAREARQQFAEVVNAAIRGRVTFITSRGRRVAAVVPLHVAEQAVEAEAESEDQA